MKKRKRKEKKNRRKEVLFRKLRLLKVLGSKKGERASLSKKKKTQMQYS